MKGSVQSQQWRTADEGHSAKMNERQPAGARFARPVGDSRTRTAEYQWVFTANPRLLFLRPSRVRGQQGKVD
jgi:hypothetical protein